MYADGLSFLEEERDSWRPFEALLELSDEALDRSTDGAHGWSGRDLMAHMCAWQTWWLEVARELALGPASPALEHGPFEALEGGAEAANARIQAEARALPMAEVRRRFSEIPGELRGYLTVVPETRWLKDAEHLRSLLENTTEHYDEHLRDLEAILAVAGRR
jgi:uncharacterized damage-inducible protein DinB